MSSSRTRDAGNESKHVHRSGRSRHSSRTGEHRGHGTHRSTRGPVPITVVPPVVPETETAPPDADPAVTPEVAGGAVEQGGQGGQSSDGQEGAEAGESRGWVHLLVPFIGHGVSTLIVSLMSGAITTLIISDATNHSLDLETMMNIFVQRTLGTATGVSALTAVAMLAFGRERVFELSGRLVNGMASGLLIGGVVAVGLGIYTWRQVMNRSARQIARNQHGHLHGHRGQGRRVHWMDDEGVEHRGVEHENGDVEEVDDDDVDDIDGDIDSTPLLSQTPMNAEAVADRWRAAASGQRGQEVVYEYDDDEGQHWQPVGGNHATTFQYVDPRLSQLQSGQSKKQHREGGQQGSVRYPQQHGAQNGVAGKVVDTGPRDSFVSAAASSVRTVFTHGSFAEGSFAMDGIDGVEQVDTKVDVVDGKSRGIAAAVDPIGRGKQDRLDKVEVTSVTDGDSTADDPASSGVLPSTLPVGAEEAIPEFVVVIPSASTAGIATHKRDSDTIAREIKEAERFDAYRKSVPATQRGTYMTAWHSRTLPTGDTGSSLEHPSGQVTLPHKDTGVEGGDKVKGADVLVGTAPGAAAAHDTGRGETGKEEGKGATAVGNDHGPEVTAAQEGKGSKAAVAQPQFVGHGAGHGSNSQSTQVPGFINPPVNTAVNAVGPALGRGPLPSPSNTFKFGGQWSGGNEGSKGGFHGKSALKVPVMFTPSAASAPHSFGDAPAVRTSPLNQTIGSEVGRAGEIGKASEVGKVSNAGFPGAVDRGDPRDATFNGVLDHMWGSMEQSRQEIMDARRRRAGTSDHRGETGEDVGVQTDGPADEEGQGRQEGYSKEDFRRSRVYDAGQ